MTRYPGTVTYSWLGAMRAALQASTITGHRYRVFGLGYLEGWRYHVEPTGERYGGVWQ